MAKKEKVVDLAPKITEEELKKIQGVVSQTQSVQNQLGVLETQKFNLLKVTDKLAEELKLIQDSLKEEYGNVSINIQDGTITEPKDEVNKED